MVRVVKLRSGEEIPVESYSVDENRRVLKVRSRGVTYTIPFESVDYVREF